MGMDDAALFGTLILDQLEWTGDDALAWDAMAWYGGDYWKLAFEAEGEHNDGMTEESRSELLVDRIVARWWSMRAGIRHDAGFGPARDWLAFGVEGVAPYWFELAATAYLGEAGRTALRFEGRYEARLAQRLTLQPLLEIDAYGKSDPERALGAGLAKLEAGLRLRYEIRREFAPYIGVAWYRLLGDTADIAKSTAQDTDDVTFVAGLRLVF